MTRTSSARPSCPYRLLACDIDDTLVRFPAPPSPRVARAIRAACDAGLIVILVTGRAFRRARPIAQALDLARPIVCNHGGSIRDAVDGCTPYRKTLPRPLTLEIVTWLQMQEVCLLLFDGDLVYCDCTTGQVVPDFQVYTRGEYSTYVHDLRSSIPDETEIVLSTSKDHEHLAEVYERTQARWGTVARVLFSHPFGLDVMPKSSKSEALAWLAGHLGVTREEVMAVGDGGNDADMLTWAGLGVAMGDAAPEAKAAAAVIAPPFEQDGLAWAVERYVLTGSKGLGLDKA
jgi:Cof subfamily protein (haloacid dehalogenase superfamily)